MTAQEVFNTIVTALLDQNEQSLDADGECAYRGEGGLKCAAGHIIPDSEYKPDMESWKVSNWRVAGIVERIVGQENMELVRELQWTHDNELPHSWKRCFQEIAIRLKLEMPNDSNRPQ